MDRYIEQAKKYAYQRLMEEMAKYEARCKDIESQFLNQQDLMRQKFSKYVKTYIGESYRTYIEAYTMIGNAIAQNITELEKQNAVQKEILRAGENRIAANKQINSILSEFMSNIKRGTQDDTGAQNMDLTPILGKLSEFIKADKMLSDKQFISTDDALELLEAS